MKKAQKKAEKEAKNNIIKQEQEKTRMQEAIKQTLEIFEITHKFQDTQKEEELTPKNIHRLTYQETTELFEQTTNMLQKTI